MTSLTHLLSHLPDWGVLVLFLVVPAGAAVAAHSIFRRFVSPDLLIEHHDVAGFLIAVVSVIYGTALGFLVVTEWNSFDAAQRTSDAEAGYVADAYAYAQALPEPQRREISTLLARYAVEVRNVEWQSLQNGTEDPQARRDLERIVRTLYSMRPGSPANFSQAIEYGTLRDTALLTIKSISDNRRQRLISAASHVPRAMPLTLGIGALLVMAFVFLFGVSRRALQYTMTALVAGSIGLFFGLIVELGSPYDGAVRVSHDAWDNVITNNDFERVAR